MKRALSVVSVCLVTPLWAHGGQYRGPAPVPVAIPMPRVPAGPPPGGPKTGGPLPPAAAPRPPALPGPPAVPPGAAPVTPGPGPDTTLDLTRWDLWWEFNKDPFVQRRAFEGGPISGSDDYYLGHRRAGVHDDVLAVTKVDRVDRIVPALAKLLASERNRDITSACLVALGKVGQDAVGVDLEAVLAERIARDDQEVRETAVLALGIAGRQRALPILAGLLRDDEEGRRLVGRSEVTGRTRAFAAYALGMLALRSDQASERQQVHDLLVPLLRQEYTNHRELRVAVVTALGLMRQAAGSSTQRLVWQTADELMAFLQRDLGSGEEVVQAHAPIAIARLLGRGNSELHQRSQEALVAVLVDKPRRGPAIQQSAAIALGELVEIGSGAVAEASVQALRQYYERGHDRMARNFALIALGRIGGDASRQWLLQSFVRINRSYERAWLALALGLVGARAADANNPDVPVAQLLLEELEQQSNQEVRCALAVAVGLCRHLDAAPRMQALLRNHEGNDRLAGYLAIGLGLLGDQSSVPLLTAILERSLRRPLLLQQCAIALGRLGDRGAAMQLVRMMQENDSVAVLAALAGGLGRIGDRRAIEPLCQMLGDEELTKLARAFVAAALGAIGDKEPLRWNVPLAVDCNYAAAVDTLTNGASGILDIL